MDDILLMLEDEIESINSVLDTRDFAGYTAHLEISRTLHKDAMSTIARLRADNAALRTACEGVPELLDTASRVDCFDYHVSKTYHAKAQTLHSALAAPDARAGHAEGGGE